jgi:hypothetical protein
MRGFKAAGSEYLAPMNRLTSMPNGNPDEDKLKFERLSWNLLGYLTTNEESGVLTFIALDGESAAQKPRSLN